MPTLREMQAAHKEWRIKNFPDATIEDAKDGMVEELGELFHHLLKQRQGIRGTWEEHEAGAKDSLADFVIYGFHLCEEKEWDFQTVLEETLASVLTRNWKENPLTGVTAPKAIQNNDVVLGNP